MTISDNNDAIDPQQPHPHMHVTGGMLTIMSSVIPQPDGSKVVSLVIEGANGSFVFLMPPDYADRVAAQIAENAKSARATNGLVIAPSMPKLPPPGQPLFPFSSQN